MGSKNGIGLQLISAIALLACAGVALWFGNILAMIFVFVGYVLGAINVLGSKLATAATPPAERLEDLGDILKRLSAEDYDRIAATARDGRKIEAIKQLRGATGAGQKDAKEAVDLIRAHDESNANA